MIIPNFTSTYRGFNVPLAKCLNSVFNVKALVVVCTFNQEKALVGPFSVITNRHVDLFEALMAAAQYKVSLLGVENGNPAHSAVEHEAAADPSNAQLPAPSAGWAEAIVHIIAARQSSSRGRVVKALDQGK